MTDRIAKKLLESSLISQEQMGRALDSQKHDGGSLGYNLVKTGAISEMAFAEFMGQVYNVPAVNLDETPPEPDAVSLIPSEVATKFQVVPVKRQGRILTVAMANPGQHLRHRRHQVHHRSRGEARRRDRIGDQEGDRPPLRLGGFSCEHHEGDAGGLRDRRGEGRGALARGSPVRGRPGRQAREQPASPTRSASTRAISTSNRTRSSSGSATASTACSTR